MPPVTGPTPVPPDALRNRLMGAVQPLGGPTRLPSGMPGVPPTLGGPTGGGMTGNMPLPLQVMGGGVGLPPSPLGGASMPPVNNMPMAPTGGYGGASLPSQMPTPLGGPMVSGISQPAPNPGRGMYTMTAGQGVAQPIPGRMPPQGIGMSLPPNRRLGWGRTGHI